MSVSYHHCCTMTLLPALLFILLCGELCCCFRKDGGFTFGADIRQYAVANDTVFVATNEMLYKLNHDLTLVQNVSQRGVLTGSNQGSQGTVFDRVSETEPWNATFRINVLLPVVKDNVLISCGVTDKGCGHCEVLELSNISNSTHNETIQAGSLSWDHGDTASVAVLITIKNPTESNTYILSAIHQSQSLKDNLCTSDSRTVNIQDADKKHAGGIFSFVDNHGTPTLGHTADVVEFVDAFQINSIIYLLSNTRLTGRKNNVRLLWLEGKFGKTDTLKSLRGVTLKITDSGGGDPKLVASSVIPGASLKVLWSGIFSADASRSNTELVVFDISPDLTGTPNRDPDFFFGSPDSTVDLNIPVTREPVAVIFRQNNMTSVLAVRHKTWIVFFIGTRDGQLIKLAVDNNYHASCPIVLYRASDDRPVHPKMLLDQVDHRHIYVALTNQLRRVPMSKCSTYRNMHECWSAQDPHCVWCGSEGSCKFEDDCKDSDWLSIPDDYQEKMVSYRVEKAPKGQITLNIWTHLTTGHRAQSIFTCAFLASRVVLCDGKDPPPQFPQCTCTLTNTTLPEEGLEVNVSIKLGKTELMEHLTLTNCSDIRGPFLCQRCIRAGCGWSNNMCSWANQGVTNDSVCQMTVSAMNFPRPEISSITPSLVSFHGRNHAVLSGHNLSDVTRVRMKGHTDCIAKEAPVWNNTGESLIFHIPGIESKGVVNVCAVLPDGTCHGSAKITYSSSPSCTNIKPSSTWMSGKRKITLTVSLLDFVEGIRHSHDLQEIPVHATSNNQNFTYDALAAGDTQTPFISSVYLKVANETLPCSNITYYPDPTFISFKHDSKGDKVHIYIQKKADKLEMTKAELLAWGVHRGQQFPCIMKDNNPHKTDIIQCDIETTPNIDFKELVLKYGDKTVTLHLPTPLSFYWIVLVLLLIIGIIVFGLLMYRSKQKKLTAEMNQLLENLELDIRNDIRQGFVDLQTEKAELMENVGAIPFLDYKHFASKIFFPESEALMKLCIKDINQDTVKVQLDECCHSLSRLIHNQLFLTSMVHVLEEQKSFTIKNKCALASLLTVALHSDLSYLTEIMKTLLQDLMQQNSNTQPKLLLRRTESVVEKLLANWMSICLYGFLRESVGQHLFLMVSALTQQITKGPVDCVTQKALYTLSEDGLLWQAQDFSSLKLNVLFAVGSEGEVSEPLEVNSLTCDSVEQVKEKILSTFKAKFGFPYNTSLRDIHIEYEQDGHFIPLEEVDKSSEVIGEVTMLNTLKHYKVPDGATIKVLSKKTHPPLSPQGSLKDDENFSGKYFHLIDPDVDEDQKRNPERKKLKLKEVHLTKLLSTKVAVHSYVENLFRSIWAMSQSRAPHAVKYFFDFLDTQADNMKIMDPDVLHIWKTNSLPLRFWVNILKNPQFVFDMEKSSQLERCLSVIAQAFMDSFSLSETQLGKHAPTNKLLYAKDIPKFKQEVKAYYKQVREQSPINDSEFKAFLQEESKKHVNEFNEAAALRELYKFMLKYFTEIIDKLNQNGAPAELIEQVHQVKNLFDGLKSCSWS
ncbi:plexin-C1 isoform X2 [Solea solea]|uniref:plexin-C1 isoform X2 n=1 Tax=Solea solea TaxID=90069 RepID=UPI00272B095F|nr:plexin-C1 isoform X2 [Solea solea]